MSTQNLYDKSNGRVNRLTKFNYSIFAHDISNQLNLLQSQQKEVIRI